VFKDNRQLALIVLSLILLLGVPPFFRGSYLVDFLIMTAIWTIYATSLRLFMTVGLVSFAHYGFFAIGAYTSALLMMKLGFFFLLALIMSGAIAATIALIIGYPLLKTKGHYFFLASFALGMVIILTFSTQWRKVFGGPMGISNIPTPRGILSSTLSYYYLAFAWAILIIALVYRLDHSRIGMEWRAVRQVDDLAALLGIRITRVKLVAFTVSCFFAGISGSLYAHYMRFICPDSFGFPMMLACLTCVVVGGMYSPWGPLIGVLLFRGITIASGGLRQWEVLIYSAILVLCIALLPEGLVSLPKRMRRMSKL
jgi:branched-chain amino acid transport system permease protein